jgi:LEA14-like dessication related protein
MGDAMRTIQMTAAAMFSLAACSSTQKVEGGGSNVEIVVERVLPKAESLEASALEVTLKLMNPRAEPVKLTRIEYEIDTKDVGGVITGQSAASDTIESSQTALVTFNERVPFPKEQDAYQAVLARGTIPANLKGSVVLADGTKLPFERRGEVATPTLPQFIVYDAQAARYEREGLDVTLFLRLINENVFPVMIEQLRYTVFVEEKKVKSEQAALGLRLIQGGAEEYEVSTIIDQKFLDKAKLKEVVEAGRIAYRVTGKIVLPRLEIPFEHTGEIELASGE